MKEREIERRFVQYAQSKDCVAIKIQTQGARGVAGWPDRLVLMPHGRVFWIEFKATGKKADVTPLQQLRIDQLTALGFDVCVHDELAEAYWALDERLR